MEKNYRSSKNIVTIANRFIKNNKNRYDKNIITDNDYIEPINIIKVKSPADQYNYIIEALQDMDLANPAILFRNNLSALGVIDILEKNNIPLYEGQKLGFQSLLVNDILNLMIFAQDTTNMNIYEDLYYKIQGYILKDRLTMPSPKC